MICHKCNHILSGSESFCPDCGNPCNKEKEVYREPEAPSVIFSAERDSSAQIFSEEPARNIRRPEKEKKPKAGLYLAVTLCAVLIGAVALVGMDFFEITPAIAALFSSNSQNQTTTTQPTYSPQQYDPASGIVLPQVNYKTTVSYVTGEKGQALRKGPDGSYGQIDILLAGTTVHIIGGASVDGKWVYVYVPEKDAYGWIDDSFLSSVIADVSTQEEEQTETTTQKSE